MDMAKRGVPRVRMLQAMVPQTAVDGTTPVTTRLQPLEAGTHPTIMMAIRAAGTTATRTTGRLVVMSQRLAIPMRPTRGFEGSSVPNPHGRRPLSIDDGKRLSFTIAYSPKHSLHHSTIGVKARLRDQSAAYAWRRKTQIAQNGETV